MDDVSIFLITMFFTLLLCGVYPWGVWFTHSMLPRYVEVPETRFGAVSLVVISFIWPMAWLSIFMIWGIAWGFTRFEKGR